MEVVCNTEKLREALGYAERAATKNLALPILSNFLVKTDKNGLRISSTNLEIGVNSWFPCKVTKQGEVAVPARILHGLVSSLISDKVVMALKRDNVLNVSSENYSAALKGEMAGDFPIIPSLKRENFFAVDAKEFCGAVGQLVGFVSNSETRPEITGVFLHKTAGEATLNAVSTDSFRLGEKKVVLGPECRTREFSVIVPSRTASEVVRIYSGTENNLNVFIENNQIGFESNKTEVVSRLVEGSYPDYQKLVPTSFNTTALVDKDDFVRKLKLVGLFSGKVNDVTLSLISGKNPEMKIYAGGGDVGENHSRIGIDLTGNELVTKFNWRYLVDGIAAAEGGKIALNFIDETKPCLIRSPEDKSFMYLVMPIRA